MNNAIGMHGLPHLPKHHKRVRTTSLGYQPIQRNERLDESPLPSMRLAALLAVSAMLSTLLLVIFALQR